MNETAESIRFRSNIGTDIVIANLISYTIELFVLILSIALTLLHCIISKLGSRFHPMLRTLLVFMSVGMLGIAVSRIITVPIRLNFGHTTSVSWMSTLDTVVINSHEVSIVLVNLAVFLIAIERMTIFILGSFFLCYKYRSDSVEMNVSYILTTTNLTGLMVNFLRKYVCVIGIISCFQIILWSNRRSQMYLINSNRALSTSYQCRENQSVVGLIVPVYFLLFVVRLCQFIFRIYSFSVGFALGALPVRILGHFFNLSKLRLKICSKIVKNQIFNKKQKLNFDLSQKAEKRYLFVATENVHHATASYTTLVHHTHCRLAHFPIHHFY
uniref:G_PROTEIN_RECEP_F1_2 domain-containing protein n=1 Tax=Heterorhabditis bacteriophora TaxID=37862 RepID=A0A1I7WYF1_HETBA